MADAAELTELERLRAEVEAHRQRELTELRSALAVARAENLELRAQVEAYRKEAYRLDGVGRQIAMEAERRETELKSQLMAKTNVLTK